MLGYIVITLTASSSSSLSPWELERGINLYSFCLFGHISRIPIVSQLMFLYLIIVSLETFFIGPSAERDI